MYTRKWAAVVVVILILARDPSTGRSSHVAAVAPADAPVTAVQTSRLPIAALAEKTRHLRRTVPTAQQGSTVGGAEDHAKTRGDGAIDHSKFNRYLADHATGGAGAAHENVAGLSDFYTLHWSVELADPAAAEQHIAQGVTPEGNLTLRIEVVGDDVNWAGFGLGSDMVSADLTVVWLSAESATGALSADKWTDFFDPYDDLEEPGATDGTSGAAAVVATNADGDRVVTFSVSRALRGADAGTAAGVDLDVGVGEIDIIFAYGSGNELGMPAYHGPLNRGTHAINIYRGGVTCGAGESGQVLEVKELHGAVMVLSWGLAAPLGVMVARYCRARNWWLDVHAALMKTAVGGAVPLAIVAFAGRAEHFVRTHAFIGVIVIMIVSVQVGLGLLCASGIVAIDKNSALARAWYWLARKLHKIVGRSLIIAANVNFYLGISWLFGEEGEMKWHVALTCYLGVMVLAFATLEFFHRWPVLATRTRDALMAVLTCKGRLLRGCCCAGLRKYGVRLGQRVGDGAEAPELPCYSWAEIKDRVGSGASWVVVAGMVVDVQQWAPRHPGGYRTLKECIGTDVTSEFIGEPANAVLLERSSKRMLERLSHSVLRAGDSATTPQARALAGLRQRRISARADHAPPTTTIAAMRRPHRHSASAWSRLSGMVVGLVDDPKEGGFRSRNVASSRGSTYNDLRDTVVARARLVRKKLLSGGVAGEDAALDSAARAGDVASRFLAHNARAHRRRKHHTDRTIRVVLVAKQPLFDPDNEPENPVWRFDFAVPLEETLVAPQPGRHYKLALFVPDSHEIVERTYTPMLDSASSAGDEGALGASVLVTGTPRDTVAAGLGAPAGSLSGLPVRPSQRYLLPKLQRDASSGPAGQAKGPDEAHDGTEPAAAATLADKSSDDARDRVEALTFVIKCYQRGRMSQLLSALRIGDSIRLRGPTGERIDRPDARDGCWTHVGLVAGGVGITPMLQLIDHQLAAHDGAASLARRMRVSLLFLNRSEDDVFLVDELEAVAAASDGAFRLHLALSKPKRQAEWRGFVGRVSVDMLRQTMPSVPSADPSAAAAAGPLEPPTTANTRIFVCGPDGMMVASEEMLHGMGYPEEVVVALQ